MTAPTTSHPPVPTPLRPLLGAGLMAALVALALTLPTYALARASGADLVVSPPGQPTAPVLLARTLPGGTR